VPELGADTQSIINRQLVDEADIVIGLFHARLGQPTDRDVSGTAEEINRSHERGAKVHVFFAEMPIPYNVDTDQLELLRAFRAELQPRGLVGTFISDEDLRAKVRSCLDYDVSQLVPAGEPIAADQMPSEAAEAVLRARYAVDREPETDSQGRVRMRSRRNRLVIENIGTAAAEDVQVQIDPIGQGQAPRALYDLQAERIPAKAAVEMSVSVTMGTAAQWRVTLTWRVGAETFTESQTISVL
jgi:hypothetical protein